MLHETSWHLSRKKLQHCNFSLKASWNRSSQNRSPKGSAGIQWKASGRDFFFFFAFFLKVLSEGMKDILSLKSWFRKGLFQLLFVESEMQIFSGKFGLSFWLPLLCCMINCLQFATRGKWEVFLSQFPHKLYNYGSHHSEKSTGSQINSTQLMRFEFNVSRASTLKKCLFKKNCSPPCRVDKDEKCWCSTGSGFHWKLGHLLLSPTTPSPTTADKHLIAGSGIGSPEVAISVPVIAPDPFWFSVQFFAPLAWGYCSRCHRWFPQWPLTFMNTR